MVRSILKERPTAPKLRRVSFDVPETLAETMEQLKARADARGFDLSIGEALVDAYARLAKRIARELEGDALDETAAGASDRDGALPRHAASVENHERPGDAP
jgi:hypothetical protein